MTDPYHADAIASYECLRHFRHRAAAWWPPPARNDSIMLATASPERLNHAGRDGGG